MIRLHTDILVVGAGLAGTLFALELAKNRPDLNILIICGNSRQQSASYLAQGGIAAVLPDTDDSMEQHLQDTLTAGAHTNKPSAVEYFVSRAPEAVCILESWDVCFDRNLTGGRAAALEGGHRVPRVLHHRDYTGRHIMQRLHKHLSRFPNIKLLQNAGVYDLVQDARTEQIRGACVWDYQRQSILMVRSSFLVLATGGVGSLFLHSTNPSTALGQGIALAEMAGARGGGIRNIQFHPTALWKSSGSRLPLISEALRGAGATLFNASGLRFMAGQHPLQDLAPRDLVARAIVAELEAQQQPYVHLDCAAVTELDWHNHFPGILKICLDAGIDPRNTPIPVVPAAHYACGGIATDHKGKTNVDRLFVIGETACTGLHGANRLASNSLLEATLMAKGLADEFSSKPKIPTSAASIVVPKLVYDPSHAGRVGKYLEELKKVMQKYCAVVKTTSGLQEAARSLKLLEEDAEASMPSESFALKSLRMTLYTAKRIVEDSLEAKENKGVFYNRDLATICQTSEQ